MPLPLNQYQGWAEQGNQQVITPTAPPSITLVQRSYPRCTVTVYESQTTTLAVIYADAAGHTPKSNPFYSSEKNGYWFFFGHQTTYDVNFSGTGILQPFTITVDIAVESVLGQIQSPWEQNVDAANYTLENLTSVEFADGSRQSTAFSPGTVQTPWLQDIDAANHNLDNLTSVEFGDGSRQTSAYTGPAATQTPWLQNIDGNQKELLAPSKILIRPVTGGGLLRFVVENDAHNNWDWVIDQTGDLITLTGRAVRGISSLAFTDSSVQTTAYLGPAQNQTPWLQSVDASNHTLENLTSVEFADGSRQTTAFNAAAIGQSPWTSDIDAANYSLSRAGTLAAKKIDIKPVGDHAAYIYDSAGVLAWIFNANGELTAQGKRNISGVGTITADTFQTWAIAGGGWPLQILNEASTAHHWVVRTDGHLYSDTGRNVNGVGSIALGNGTGHIDNIAQLYFTDASTQTTAYKGVAATQTPWLQTIDGARKTLSQVGQIVLWPLTGVQRFGILNDAGTGWDWLVDSTGNLSSATFKSILTIGSLGFSDTTIQTTAYKGVAANQTPWLQQIDGNRKILSNPGGVHIYPNTPADISFAILDAANPANLDFYIVNGDLHIRGKNISGVAQLGVTTVAFGDATTQTTAFKGIAATQTPWLQDIQAARKSLNQASLISIWPLAGQMRFGILTEAGDNWDWQVDANGNLFSGTGRSITGLGTITTGTFTTTGIGVMGGNLNWSSAPANGDLDTALSRVSAGILRLYGPAGSEGDLYLRGITASGSIVTSAGFYAQTAGQNGAFIQGNGNVGGINYYSQPSPGGAAALVINAFGGFVGPGGVNTAGDIFGKSLNSRSNGVNWPFVIVNAAGDSHDWLIDATGNLATSTGRIVQGVLDVRTANYTAAYGAQMSGNSSFAVQWSPTGVFYDSADIRIRRQDVGALTIDNPSSGGWGTLYAGTLIAQSAVITNGQFYAGGNAGMGSAGTPYTVDITTPTGQKTLWIEGGIITSVTG